MASITSAGCVPEAQSPEAPSPATVTKDKLHKSFRAAKRQVNRDLEIFITDAGSVLEAEQQQPQNQQQQPADGQAEATSECSPDPSDDDDACSLQRVIMVADRCLGEDVESFRHSIQSIVDHLEELRRGCRSRSHKALATRLLFILTRCSRLVMSEESSLFGAGGTVPGFGHAAAYMTVQPRSKGPGKLRRFSGFPMLRNQVSLDKVLSLDKIGGGSPVAVPPHVSPRGAASPLVRSATAPTRAFKDVMQGIHHLRIYEPRQQQQEHPVLSPMPESPMQSPRSPSVGSEPSTPHAGRQVGPSPLGRSVVTALEAELEQAAVAGAGSRGSEGDVEREQAQEVEQPVRPRAAATAEDEEAVGPSTSPSKRRGLLKMLKERFASLTGREPASDSGTSDMSRDAQGPGLGSSPDSGSTPRILSAKPPSGRPPPAHYPHQHQQQHVGGSAFKAVLHQQHDSLPPLQHFSAIVPPLQVAGRRSVSADVEHMPHNHQQQQQHRRVHHPGLQQQLLVQVGSPRGSPQQQQLAGLAGASPRASVVCRICEQQVSRDTLPSHSAVCARLATICKPVSGLQFWAGRRGTWRRCM